MKFIPLKLSYVCRFNFQETLIGEHEFLIAHYFQECSFNYRGSDDEWTLLVKVALEKTLINQLGKLLH